MKQSALHQIAAQCGVSIATVSKAVNHCPGVSSATREQILRAAASIRPQNACAAGIDLYIMLPELPTYFWCELNDLLIRRLAPLASRFSVKYNRYTNIGDDYSITAYLDEAERLHARALLIAADIPDALIPRITELAQSRGVFLLLEENQVPGAFFFGSDHREDGRTLARLCLTENPAASHLLAVGEAPHRLAGVRDVFSGQITCVEPPRGCAPSFSAMLARRLAACQGAPFDAALCLDGFCAGVVLALRKCGMGNIPCYGVENEPEARPYLADGSLRALVCQDLDAICAGAADAIRQYLEARTFPRSKYRYFPSLLRRGKEE